MLLDITNSGSNTLSNLVVTLGDVPSAKISGTLAPKATANAKIVLEVPAPVRPTPLAGELAFQANGSPSSLPLSLVVPASVFIQPLPITEEQFATILTSGAQLFHASASVRVRDATQAITKLAELLHVKVIKSSEAVALYGRSLQNHHVCVLVKSKADSMSVDIKATDGSLSASLINEVKHAFD